MLPILTLLAAIEPGQPITASVPWAVAPEGPRTHFERVTGERLDPSMITPIREGDMVFGAESMAVGVLEQLDIPLPALDHPPTPGILILAMDGVQLKKQCGGAQDANGALNCTPLVDGPVDFPEVKGGAQAKASILQQMRNFYEDFNLVIATDRPPDWVPYTLSVIGGTSGNAGYENGVCGIANVACDGAKRNHVSLSFSDSCPGDAALTAGQETAHNWGLEHTDVEQDIMYPYVVGAGSFLDQCMTISHATGSGVTQCTYVHELYCPQGQGEQQNSYGELMGVFGAKAQDTTKPTIVEISPPDGSVFTTEDAFTVTATITDDFNFLGVKWSWLEGRPEDFADGYSRCTNQVCNDSFDAWWPVDEPYPFLNLKNPPANHYTFQVEAMDAYGNYVTQTVAYDVVPAGPGTASDSAGDTTGGEATSAADASASASASAEGTAGEPTSGGGEDTDPTSGGGSATAGSASAGSASAGTMTGFTMTDPEGDGEDGCGCRTGAQAPAFAGFALLLGLARRRRR